MLSNSLKTLGITNKSRYVTKILDGVEYYNELIINEDRTVKYKRIKTDYFIQNDIWNVESLGDISNFKEQYESYKGDVRNIRFLYSNPYIKLELKYIVLNKLFSSEWNFTSLFYSYGNSLKNFAEFMNTIYPDANSVLELDKKKVDLQWVDWLSNRGLNTSIAIYECTNGKTYTHRKTRASFWHTVHGYLTKLLDEREEWDKDDWDVRNLVKYNIEVNRTSTNHYISFKNIKNQPFKETVKRFCKTKLLRHEIKPSTAQGYLTELTKFFCFISEIEPTWLDFKELRRLHIEKYIEHIHKCSKVELNNAKANPNHYILSKIGKVESFLSYIQLYDYPEAPNVNVRKLIFESDKPVRNKSTDTISYVPDFVLEQIVQKYNFLNKDVQPVVLIMLHTGLRVSDALSLKHNCLIRLNNKYWLETDIKKTSVKGHRVPIDDKTANMIAALIDKSKQVSNKDNNPEQYIFCRYSGSRKGLTYAQGWMRSKLWDFARKQKIVDEMGNLFHFSNHCFRHTYAIKMLNSGVDIMVLQELLAHASPEMTLVYARLLDDTKRKAFEKAVKNGVFSFDDNSTLVKEDVSKISEDVLDMLWKNHKLEALNTPYGTCLQRNKGRCNYAKQPPCLTCNNGNPCKDLGIGIFDGDVKKYEIYIQSTKQLIEQGKLFDRLDMVKENEELLKFYEDIYKTIKQGNIIYGRLERLKKFEDDI